VLAGRFDGDGMFGSGFEYWSIAHEYANDERVVRDS
jgi:hypothetical protein